MKLADLTTSGVINRPTGQFWYGLEGTRKTGTAVSPKSLVIDLERGSDQYNVDRISIGTYAELLRALDLIIHEKSYHEIIVLDPIEVAEKMVIGETCRQLKIDGLQGLPHGAAWQYLRENFDRELMARFEQIRRTGRHCVVIGHASVRTVTLPGLAEPFDRFESRLDKRNAETLIEWADHVLFFDWDLRTAKNREGYVRAVGGKEPIIHVVHGPGWNAKNRVGLTEPLKTGFPSLAPLFGMNSATTTPAEPPDTPPPPSRSDREVEGGVEQPAEVDPDKYPVEPLLTDQESKAVEAIFSALPQERLYKFLQSCEAIRAGEDWHFAGAMYLRRILNNPEGFKNAVLTGS